MSIVTIYTYLLSLVVALCVAWYIYRSKNPEEKGSQEYQALRLCRIALLILLFTWNFGLLGLPFVAVAFILAIMGIVKGRTAYGIMIIVGCVCLPFIGFMITWMSHQV